MPQLKRPPIPEWLGEDFPLGLALDEHEGGRAARIFLGDDWAFRESELEPTLLPHLARLCHDFSLGEVLSAAEYCGLQSDWCWPQLWELTVARLVDRFDSDVFELQLPAGRRSLHAVYSALADPSGASVAAADAELAADPEPGLTSFADLSARLLFADPTEDRFQRVVDLQGPDDFDAEGVRAVVTAGRTLGHDMNVWFADALDNGDQWRWIGRRSHLLPIIDNPEVRIEVANELVDHIMTSQPEPWFLALATTRLTPYSPIADRLVDAAATSLFHPVWQDFLGWLPTQRFAAYGSDTTEAHPFSWLLATVLGPHETTVGVAAGITSRWGSSPAMAAPTPIAPSLPPILDTSFGAPGMPDNGNPAGRPGMHFIIAPDSPGDFVRPDRIDDRTLGVDVFAEGRQLERAMIAGTPTFVEVSIGNESAAFSLHDPANIAFGDSDRLRLPVTLVETSLPAAERVVHEATMSIRRDPASSASVEFEVTPRGDRFAALITVWTPDRSAAIQAASLTCRVVGSAQDEVEADVSFALSLAMLAPAGAPTSELTASVVHDDHATITGLDFDITASVSDAVNHIETVTTSVISGSRQRFATNNAALIRPALIVAAQEGHRLHRDLGLAKFDEVERLHVIAVSGQSVLALELVYAGEPPDEDATLCETWFASGTCSECVVLDASEQRKRVCPDWFWGLSKEIEHVRGRTQRDFAVGPLPQTRRSEPVAVPAAPLIGASNLIIQELVNQGTDLRTETASLALPVTITPNWADWVDQVSTTKPDLLVAMGHHGIDAFGGTERPALEIGGQVESLFREHHVRSAGSSPGPAVFLIGCDTATSDRGLASFANDFGQWSPLVIATVGEVLAREASMVVGALLSAMQEEKAHNGSTGSAVRRARRALLLDHRLAGLQLVVHANSSTLIA